MSHAVHLEDQHTALAPDSAWRRLSLPVLGAGVILIIIAMVAGFMGGEALKMRFFFSYLVAYMFALSIALGSLFFVMVSYLARAGWSTGLRRIPETLMATLPVLALLAIPMLLGVDVLYAHWVEPHGDPLIVAKQAYLNKPFFYVRAVFVLLVWCALALIFYRASVRQDHTGEKDITRKLQMYAAPGIAFFALSVTVAAIDWLMSLTPHWFSTIWGVYFFAGCMIAMFSVLSLLTMRMRGAGLLGPAVTMEHQQDLGKYLFGFVVFWAYIAFSQYMLIWYANMPEETLFYADRLYMVDEVAHVRKPTSWFAVTLVLAVGHFLIPFFFLMSRHIKRRNVTLAIGALWLLAMHYLDLYWIAMPVAYPAGLNASGMWMDGLTLAGTVLALFGAFGWLLGRERIVPIRDPRLPEALKFHNF